MKKIDIHAHVRPKKYDVNQRWLTEEKQFEIYDKLQIEKGGILPLLFEGETPWLLTAENAKELADENPEKFFWYTTVDLLKFDEKTDELYEFLKSEKASGAKGVGEITTNIDFDDEKTHALFSACEKLKLPVLSHISPEKGSEYGLCDSVGLYNLEKMLKLYPDMIYIGHSFAFWCEITKVNEETRLNPPDSEVDEGRIAELMRENKNLYCDLSAGSGATAMMRDERYAVKFINEFQDRIMYGCDITSEDFHVQKEFSDFLDNLVNKNLISESVYRKVVRENAIKVFNI